MSRCDATRTAMAENARIPLGTKRVATSPRLYWYIDTIVRHGSIRKAAVEIGIAPSALNRRLLDAEKDYGVALFARLRHGLRLTPAGVMVAEHVRATLEDAARLSDRLRGLDGAVRGAVAVASAESAATAILPPLFAELHQAHSELQFRLQVGAPNELLGWLLDGQADLILTHDPPHHPDATVLASAAEPFCAVMRPGHSLAAERTVSLAACFAFPLVVAADDLVARAMFERLRALTPPQRPFALTTNLFEAMKRFVARSDAISFQFQIRPRSGIVTDDLVSIPIEEQAVRDAHLYLACRTDRELPPAVAAVARRIEAVLLASPA